MAESDSEFGSLFGGAAIVVVGFVAQLGLTMLVRVAFARHLSVEAFGLVALLIASVHTIGLLSVAGLDIGIGRYLPRCADAAERADVLRSAFQVAVPMTLGAGVLLSLSAGTAASQVFGVPGLRPILLIAAVGGPFFGLTRLAIGVVQGQERTLPKVLIENLLTPVAQLLLTIIVVSLGLQVAGIAWAYVGGYVVAGLVGSVYVVTRSPLRIRGPATMRRELLAFSAPLLITGAMVRLMEYLDTFLLGALSTPTNVGIYNTVYPLSQLMLLFLTSFGFLLMPAVSRLDLAEEFEAADHLFKLTSKWIFFLTLPVATLLVYFPSETISIVFGAKYGSGGLALSILAAGFLLHASVGPTGKGLIAMGRTRLLMLDNVAGAVVNVVLNVLLIPQYGFVGAAIASVIAYATVDALYLVQLYRTARILPINRDLLRVAAISLPMTVLLCGYAGRSIVQSFAGALGFVVLAGLVHLLVLLRYGGISDEELSLLTTLERRADLDLSSVRAAILWVRG